MPGRLQSVCAEGETWKLQSNRADLKFAEGRAAGRIGTVASYGVSADVSLCRVPEAGLWEVFDACAPRQSSPL